MEWSSRTITSRPFGSTWLKIFASGKRAGAGAALPWSASAHAAAAAICVRTAWTARAKLTAGKEQANFVSQMTPYAEIDVVVGKRLSGESCQLKSVNALPVTQYRISRISDSF
jgi:hypothetical protein